jgi:ATP-dependent helicase HepA
LALEAVYLLEATAPSSLHLDRFLPPTPLRVLVDEKGENLHFLLAALDDAELEPAPTGLLEEQHALFASVIPKLLEAARGLAAVQEASVKKQAYAEAESRLGAESRRLRDLKSLNPAVSEADIDKADSRARETLRHIVAAESRLDALRIVLLGKSRF